MREKIGVGIIHENFRATHVDDLTDGFPSSSHHTTSVNVPDLASSAKTRADPHTTSAISTSADFMSTCACESELKCRRAEEKRGLGKCDDEGTMRRGRGV